VATVATSPPRTRASLFLLCVPWNLRARWLPRPPLARRSPCPVRQAVERGASPSRSSWQPNQDRQSHVSRQLSPPRSPPGPRPRQALRTWCRPRPPQAPTQKATLFSSRHPLSMRPWSSRPRQKGLNRSRPPSRPLSSTFRHRRSLRRCQVQNPRLRLQPGKEGPPRPWRKRIGTTWPAARGRLFMIPRRPKWGRLRVPPVARALEWRRTQRIGASYR
jgi:hypothetical protein